MPIIHSHHPDWICEVMCRHVKGKKKLFLRGSHVYVWIYVHLIMCHIYLPYTTRCIHCDKWSNGNTCKSIWDCIPRAFTLSSGHSAVAFWYFVQKMHLRLSLQSYTIHTTYLHNRTKGERHRLREAMIFNNPPTYYTSLTGVLSHDLALPIRLLPTWTTIWTHISCTS